MRRWAIVIVLLGARHLSARTQAGESAEGALLYQEQCGVCHGMMASESSFRPGMPEPQELVRSGRALPSWVPGSLMFYQEPDPEIRRQIIASLEASH